jgi:hypothetical protein
MPDGTLDAAVDSLLDDVSNIINKPELDAEDDVIVDGKVAISCLTFNDLRRGKWLDNWMVMAGIQMSDKPYFVKYGECIPLHGHGRRGMKPMPRPLNGWRKTIEKSQTEHGKNILVYFCSLHTNGNDFSLLEINERERKIYHYDSKADPGVIDGRVKQTPVGKAVQVSMGS